MRTTLLLALGLTGLVSGIDPVPEVNVPAYLGTHRITVDEQGYGR